MIEVAGGKWHAGRMLFALARHFDFMRNKMVPELEISGSGLREDLVIISAAGYATVVEIKVTRADWQADQHKRRWPSKHIARFFYAVPLHVYRGGVPAHVPEHCGILTVQWGGRDHHGYDSVSERRAAQRMKVDKIPADRMRRLDENFYYRYWRLHMERERNRLMTRPQRRALEGRS